MTNLIWSIPPRRPLLLWFRLWAILGVALVFNLLLSGTIFHDVLDAAEYIGKPTIAEAVLLAPVLEELLFRSWVTNWLPGLYGGLFAIILFSIGLLSAQTGPIIISIPILLLVIPGAVIIKSREVRNNRETVPTRTTLFVGLLAVIIFALWHVTNYNLHHMPYWQAPLLVLPQLVAGTVLLITRLRLSLIASILVHAVTNRELMLYIVLAPTSASVAVVTGIVLTSVKIAILGHTFWEKGTQTKE